MEPYECKKDKNFIFKNEDDKTFFVELKMVLLWLYRASLQLQTNKLRFWSKSPT